MKVKILSAYFLLVGCGTIEGTIPSKISPELEPYVVSFYADIDETPKYKNKFKSSVSEVTLVDEYPDDIETSEPTTLGICQHYYTNRVFIRRAGWDRMSEGSRWNVVYHELVHCVLNKQNHDAKGLMAPEMWVEMTMEEFHTNWTNYNP